MDPQGSQYQDLAARFTLDSATEFLFGHDVGSLSANIPYPTSAAHLNKLFDVHPSTIFVKAFSEGQILSASRSSFGRDWPLLEFWSDKVAGLRKVMDDFTEPLMENALAKESFQLKNGIDVKDDHENETLLAHLVKSTEGKQYSSNLCFVHSCLFSGTL